MTRSLAPSSAPSPARTFVRTLAPLLAMLPCLTLPAVAEAGTWSVQKENLATILIGLDFNDSQTGYVAGGQDGLGPVIYKTGDGGRTWVQQMDSLQSMSYLDVATSDGQHAIAGGLGAFYRFAGASYTDDGRTWKPSKDRWLASAYQDVEAVDSENMYLIGLWSTVFSYGEGVAASRDGGRTFTYFDWGIDTSPRYGSFVNASTGYLAGGQWPSESLARYGKGAHRFSQHMKVPGEAKVARAQATTGYRATIAKTVNGGESWEMLYDDYDRFYFNKVQFVDADHGWVVAEGDAGAYILATSDGGKTWTEQHMQASGSLLALSMVNAQEGWAGGALIGATGFKALLLHTTDGGQTWTPYETSLRYYIMNLDALPNGQAWAVAYGVSGAMSVLQYVP